MQTESGPPFIRRLLKWGFRLAGLLLLIIVATVLLLLRNAIYCRVWAFPAEARAWETIRETRVAVDLDDGWQDFRGVCHSHSALSHDSDVPFEEVLRVMQETGRQFICMNDHCEDGKAEFGPQWEGVHDGVLFVRGYEMGHGFMPWGLPPGTVLDCGGDAAPLAQQIEDLGGLLFIAHTEEPRDWDLPQIDGMEIYNIHADFKDERLWDFAMVILLNQWAYPDQTFRFIFDEQTSILALWDRLNQDRKMVGIAANDCHQNNGVVGVYTDHGTLLLRDTSPKDLTELNLNFVTRGLLRLACGPLEPGRELFHVQIDPYERMTRFVSTHVLAAGLTQPAILDGLQQGRAFIGFDMIADSTGFTVLAENADGRATLGETLPFTADTRLRAGSPHHCRFTVKREGRTVLEQEGTAFDWKPDQPGKYRIEAYLKIRDEWVPWVYTNPLELL